MTDNGEEYQQIIWNLETLRDFGILTDTQATWINDAITALSQASGSVDIDQWEAQENIKTIDNLNAINESLVDRIKQLESQQSEPAKPKAEDGELVKDLQEIIAEYRDTEKKGWEHALFTRCLTALGGGK